MVFYSKLIHNRHEKLIGRIKTLPCSRDNNSTHLERNRANRAALELAAWTGGRSFPESGSHPALLPLVQLPHMHGTPAIVTCVAQGFVVETIFKLANPTNYSPCRLLLVGPDAAATKKTPHCDIFHSCCCCREKVFRSCCKRCDFCPCSRGVEVSVVF